MATVVSAPLPDVDLDQQASVTVDAGDPAATITAFVIQGYQSDPEAPDANIPDPLLLARDPALAL